MPDTTVVPQNLPYSCGSGGDPRAVETIVLLTPTPRNGSDARRGDPFRRVNILYLFFAYDRFFTVRYRNPYHYTLVHRVLL